MARSVEEPGSLTVRIVDERPPAIREEMDPVLAAMTAGRDFLLTHQRPSGLWMDFRMGPGWSDEWVTGYVGDRLSLVPGTRSARERAWKKLKERSQVRPVGWGYNVLVPQCADTTTWVLRLARSVGGLDAPEARAALASLHDFRRADGLMTTFAEAEPIRRFMRANPHRDYSGWTGSHVCVTAATAGLAGIVDHQNLLDHQLSDGHWHGYWWESDTFVTALATETLADAAAQQRAADWAESMLDSKTELNAFDLANLLAVCTIAGRVDSNAALIARDRLLATARDDGSWESGAVMRVPHPDDVTPDESSAWIPDGLVPGSLIRDSRRIFTTATVVWALLRWAAGHDRLPVRAK